MKLGRNDPCYCGSGLKYKKCCMSKASSNSQINQLDLSISSILSAIRFGLENLDALIESDRKVRVKDISILNENTIQCKFYSYSENSIDIKLEIGTIMGFLSGFLKNDSFESVEFKYYAIRAYGQNDRELLYAISSKQTAQLAGKGDSIGWLQSTLFQENTDDYRLGLAKRIISEIETTLRHVIKDVLSKEFKDNWWDQAINNKLGRSIKETYFNQFGDQISDGNILINYAYLIQLQKIITTHWNYFKHLFGKKIEFENSLNELNIIRREEAHNRIITEEHLAELNRIHTATLSTIAQVYPEKLPTYLIDNWRSKIKAIMSDSYKPKYKGTELIDELNPKLELLKSITSTIHVIEYLEKTISKLESVVTPIQKKKLHKELLNLFQVNLDLQKRKLSNAKSGELDELLNTITLIEQHEMKINIFVEKFLIPEI